jgi:hemoglobin
MTQRAEERRADWVADQVEATGIDEAMIARLVDGFYGRVRSDPLLGPVFAARIKDWEPHLARMRDFWSGVALMTGRYKGKPMQKHLPLGIERAHFDRWLALFEETAAELCPSAAAAFFIDRAHRIAESLQLGLAYAGGRLAEQLRAVESRSVP